MHVCITGGSGFIGANLARRLSKRNDDVVIIDKNSSKDGSEKFVHCDLSQDFDTKIVACDTIFHFAASPSVKESMENPGEGLQNNVIATQNILEACRKQGVKKIVFASTSAVYGNADVMPTPENSELKPISVYGATKVACEALIRAYCETYGMDGIILRYANIYGPGSRHGIMYDFVKKLQRDRKHLEILGNGRQSKSYLYIDDAIDATLLAAEKKGWNVFNIGSERQTTALEIASMIAEKMEIKNLRFVCGTDEAGWIGDIPRFLLDISKINALGWKEHTNIKDGIWKYVEWIIGNALHN
jgi:UDP-glucose 4-epimerase